MAAPVQPRGGGYPATNGYSHPNSGPSQPNPQLPALGGQTSQDVNEILRSELGVNALLSKLRESTISARDFAGFLKKRASIEHDHATGLKKLCQVTHNSIHREDGPKRGTLTAGLEESNRVHEQIAENEIAFSDALNTMSEELTELANNIDRGRKQWKQAALVSEKRGPDAFHALEKVKQKTDGFGEEYERLRNGGKPKQGFHIGSGRHHEEETRRKLETADMEYQKQVEVANKVHHDLFHNERPQTVKALKDLILESDSGLSLQLQKYVALNESLVLNNGRTVSAAGQQGDLRKALLTVDDERDLESYVLEFASRAPPQNLGIVKFGYERHPALSLPPPPVEQPPQQAMPPPQPVQQAPPSSFHHQPISPQRDAPGQRISSGSDQFYGGQPGFNGPPPSNYNPPARKLPPGQVAPKPLKPVFGVPLESLLIRDGNAVPIVVIQCMTAVELYGLGVEGIYRQAGQTSHIQKIRDIFDNDASRVDFRNPDHFFQDVNSVASALKQFFRDLPDPVMTYALYDEFIEAAKLDDDNLRRDSLHGLINRLPDAHYATIRALVLHLSRVLQNSAQNKMNSWNLALCFGPTLMSSRQEDLRNTNWQNRALDTILRNALDIFDED